MIDEKVMLKANILGGMNAFMTDYCEDEYVLEMWFKGGVPDGADETDLMEFAQEEDTFCDIANQFARCLRCM